MLELYQLVRKNILEMQPFAVAETGNGKILLNTNENALGSPLQKWYHRYPDPHQQELRNKISTIKNIAPENIALGNGSSECLDLLMRIFCEPGKDNIIILSPAPDHYLSYAAINDVQVKQVPLNEIFQPDLGALEQAVDEHSKMILICTPNDPTGNSIDHEDIEVILMNFPGIVVIDESYINFSRSRSFIPEIKNYPNLVVLQTFSKAWGLAGLRVGMLLASETIINLVNRIRSPYNLNSVSQEMVIRAIDHLQEVNTMIMETVNQRKQLVQDLATVSFIKKIYPTEANFILAEVEDADKLMAHLNANGILVSSQTQKSRCENCLRITVGTEKENKLLIQTLKDFQIQ